MCRLQLASKSLSYLHCECHFIILSSICTFDSIHAAYLIRQWLSWFDGQCSEIECDTCCVSLIRVR